MPFAVEVIWNDACTRVGAIVDVDLLDFTPGIINRDVGWLVGVKDDFVVLAEEYSDETDDFRGVTSIPMGDVVEINRLGKKERLWPNKQGKKQKEALSVTDMTR